METLKRGASSGPAEPTIQDLEVKFAFWRLMDRQRAGELSPRKDRYLCDARAGSVWSHGRGLLGIRSRYRRLAGATRSSHRLRLLFEREVSSGAGRGLEGASEDMGG